MLRILLAFTMALPLTGCLYSREIAQTRRLLEREMPDLHLDQQVVLSLGPGALRFAGWITRMVDADDPDVAFAGDVLRDVYRVKVGVYEADFRTRLSEAEMPDRLRDVLQHEGWTMAVKVREDDGFVWLYYRERRGTVRDLYAVVLDDENLVIARMKGRLDRIVARAMDEYAPPPAPPFARRGDSLHER